MHPKIQDITYGTPASRYGTPASRCGTDPSRYGVTRRATGQLTGILRADGLHVFLALSGIEAVVKKLWPLESDLNDYINEDKGFGLFKSEAVIGGDTERTRMALKPDSVLICLGQTSDVAVAHPDVDSTGGYSFGPVQPQETETLGYAPGTEERDERDAAVEFANRTGLRDTYDEVFEDVPDNLHRSNNGLMAYAAMGAALIFVYNYLDVNI